MVFREDAGFILSPLSLVQLISGLVLGCVSLRPETQEAEFPHPSSVHHLGTRLSAQSLCLPSPELPMRLP